MSRFANIILILTMVSINTGCSRKADIIFRNGVIHTVDENMTIHQSVAVGGDRIIAVGSNEEVAGYSGPDTRHIELDGKSVYPGFIDSHYHFNGVGKREFTLNLDGCGTFDDFLARVKMHAAGIPTGEWVIGRGWMEEDWPDKRFPNREDLDAIVPNNPVILTRADGHAVIVNSMALEVADVNRTTQSPAGGEILRMQDSDEPNGILLDNAIGLVKQHVPSNSGKSAIEKYARKANAIALSNGITQIHDMGSDLATVSIWRALYKSGDLQVRIRSYLSGPGEFSQQLLNADDEFDRGDQQLRIAGIKIVADGALGSRGAALLENYSDADSKGLFIYQDDEIYPTILSALQQNIQVAIHAIGDGANRRVLDLYEQALHETGRKKLPRFRIEHAQIVALDDIPRFAKMGAVPSMQPSHAIGDLHFAVRRLGMDRMKEGYPWRTLIDSGCFIPAGSDAPVEEGNPLIEFYAACVRRDTTGFAGSGWHRELRMTREEALKSLTIWGAKAVYEEDVLGSIEPGKLADLVVLDGNLMTAPESQLFKMNVKMTMICGKIVYKNGL